MTDKQRKNYLLGRATPTKLPDFNKDLVFANGTVFEGFFDNKLKKESFRGINFK